jgi:hypothetical protein
MKIATFPEAAGTRRPVRAESAASARAVLMRPRNTASTQVTHAARPSSVPVGGEIAPPVVNQVLRQPGRQLDGRLQARFGEMLGADLSGVVLHTDSLAAESASVIAASAYTVGNHIAFAAGSFAPETDAGQRLLLHELVHVAQTGASNADPAAALTLGAPDSAAEHQAQQITFGNHPTPTDSFRSIDARTVRRAPPDGGAATPQTAPQPAAPGAATLHIVVRDRGLDLGGGILVSDLEAAKTKMMTKREAGGWTLVLSIHASQDRLGAQAPPDWQRNAKFYDASAVNSLFGGDATFVQWRDQFGPTRVVLYGCQVSAQFEQTIDNNLVRGGTGPTAQGLGPGCHPIATTKDFGVKTRAAFNRLSADEQAKMTAEVQQENRTWGYYGQPPVPNDKVLDYLFDGVGKGSWASVEVQVLNKSTGQYESAQPPIPFWNRMSNSTFLHSCNPIVLGGTHTPTAPPVAP